MSKELYDAAVNEVRGQETAVERLMLEDNTAAWRDALRSVIDEMDSQFKYRSDVFDDETEFMSEGSGEYIQKAEDYKKWKLGARTFKKHIEARLATVNRMVVDDDVTIEDFAHIAISIRDADGDEAYDEAVDSLYDLLDKFERLHPLQ